MRALKQAVYTLACFGLALSIVGCGQDFQGKVSCKDDDECLNKAINSGYIPLYRDGSASVEALPRCCEGTCVLPAGGCDSGYRYLTNDPDYGACVEDPMCPVIPDMSIPPDLAGETGG